MEILLVLLSILLNQDQNRWICSPSGFGQATHCINPDTGQRISALDHDRYKETKK